jgi:hypothetical protein
MSARGRPYRNGICEETAVNNFSQEEPRTMGDESFEMWVETMAGLDDCDPFGGYVTGGQQSSRIPNLTSRWAYENWLQRRADTGFGTYVGRRTRVPQISRSRVPVSSDTLKYWMSLRSWESGSEHFCDRRIMVSQPSRIPVPNSAGQTQKFTSYQCVYTNSSGAVTAPWGSRIPIPTRRAAVESRRNY